MAQFDDHDVHHTLAPALRLEYRARFSSARFTPLFGGKMRYLVTGGSRFDPQIGRDFHALGIDILQAYGLTETTAAAFATSPGRQRHRLGGQTA